MYHQQFYEQFYKLKQLSTNSAKLSRLNYNMAQNLKGITYGRFISSDKAFTVAQFNSSKPILSVDYKKITNATISRQQELLIQTGQEEIDQNDNMTEIRFFIDQRYNQNSNKESEVTFTQQCLRNILQNSKAGQKAGEAVAKLQQVNLVVPRGKYALTFYSKHLGLHGSTFSHKVLYSDIIRGFILPLSTELQVAIVLALSRPVTLGQTLHKFLVMQIRKDAQQKKVNANINALENGQSQTSLQKTYKGEQFQIIVDLLHAIAKISLIQPGQNFQSSTGHPCVKASVKGQSGYLFILKKSIIFIPRLVFYLKIEDLVQIQFMRVKVSRNQFDLKLTVKNQEKDIQLMSIDRKDLIPLQNYFKQKGVNVIGEQHRQMIDQNQQSENQQQDEDFKEDEIVEGSQQSSDDEEIGSQQQDFNQTSSKNNPRKKKIKIENTQSSANKIKSKKSKNIKIKSQKLE